MRSTVVEMDIFGSHLTSFYDCHLHGIIVVGVDDHACLDKLGIDIMIRNVENTVAVVY